MKKLYVFLFAIILFTCHRSYLYAQTSNQNQVVQDLVRSIATHIDVESTRVNTSTKPSEAGVGIEIIADDPSYTHDVKIETSVNGLKVSYRNNKPIELTAPVRDLWSITVIPGTNRILPTYGCSTQSPDFNNSQGVYYWEDKDGDGYFVDNIILVCGAPPSGFIKEEDLKGVDCDDTVYHTEQPDPYYYFDEDGDGYPGSWGTFCERPPGGKQYNELKSGVLDCNDNDPTVWQRTTSFIDIDGDGYTNGTVFLCSQGELPEGFTNQSYGEDCDDENPNIFRELELYIDNDGDGYTDGRITMCIGTSIPMGYQLTSLGIDCDDEDPNITRLCCIPIQDLQVREPLFVEGCSIEDLAPSTGFSLSIETQTSISIDSFLQHLELFDRTICGLKSVAYQDWLISNNAGRIRVDRTFYLEEESYLSNYTEEIYIEDNTAPIPNQEELPELFLDCADQFIQPPTANDACDGEITGTRNTEIEYDDPNDFTITWTFMDLFGNQSTQQQHVKVTNTDPPVPYVPTLPEIIAECSFQITEVPKAIDSCGGEINATTDNDQEYFEEGTYTITWTFTDGNGLQTTQEQNVTLIKLDPIPSLPELEVIVTQCSVTDIQAPTATGGCNGEIITGIRDESIIYSEQGEYIIIWTFDDGNGNMTTQEQMVVVEDTEAPIADEETLPDLIGQCSVTDIPAPTATDNCAGELTGTTSDPLSYTEQGSYTIVWTYNDGNGNMTTQEQMVVVEDTEAPIADEETLPDLIGQCSVTDIPAPTATDNCAGEITGTTSDPLSYTEQGSYTIVWTYDDGNGNMTTQEQMVVVEDTEAPIADEETLPDLIGQCSVTDIPAPTATDNCAGEITGTTSDPLSYTEQGSYTIVWTYDDGNGNISTQNQMVIVEDSTAPILSLHNIAVQLDDSGNASITISDIEDGTTDNCTAFEDLVFELSQSAFSCGDIGEVMVGVKVWDLVGNPSESTVDITVLEPQNPMTTEINSSVPKNSNDKVVIFSNAPASLGLPNSTTLTASNIPESYSGLSYQWSVKYSEGENFGNVPGGNSATLNVSSSGDFVATYKVVVISDSGCITEEIISVISVEAACDKGGANKVQVCHLPGGNFSKRKTICVNVNAVDALLANSPGSFLGNCNISYRMEAEPELIILPWNTSIEVVNDKINKEAEDWFGQRKIKLNISSSSFDPIKSGIYEFEVELNGSEEFSLEEPIIVQVLVSDKQKALGIELSSMSIPYQAISGDIIATLSTNDLEDNVHSYRIDENPNLEVFGDKLIWRGSGNPQAQIVVTIFSTDRAGQVISREVTFTREIPFGDFILYPNPANQETNILVKLDQPAKVGLRVYNAVGRMVISDEFTREKTFTQRIDLINLSPGMYTVQLQLGELVITKRLIKM